MSDPMEVYIQPRTYGSIGLVGRWKWVRFRWWNPRHWLAYRRGDWRMMASDARHALESDKRPPQLSADERRKRRDFDPVELLGGEDQQ